MRIENLKFLPKFYDNSSQKDEVCENATSNPYPESLWDPDSLKDRPD